MSLARTSPRFSLTPEVEHLPDGRRAYTRYREIAAGNQITDDLLTQLALGAVDPFPLFTSATYGPCLVRRTIEPAGGEGKTYEVQRFEEIKATGETSVGNADKIKLEDGRTATVQTYLQLSADTYAPVSVGTSGTHGYLQREEMQDPGTVRTIKRTWMTSGTLSIDEQTRNQGKLSIQTIVSAVDVPSTPSGYTLIGEPVQNPSGLPVYSYTYAKGTGRVTTTTRTLFNGKLTETAITYLGTDDESTPSGVLRSESDDKRDGYTVHERTYYVVADDGYLINNAQDTREGGKLVVHRSERIASAPATPSATLGGTVALISSSTRQADGYALYSSTWAEGYGEASRSIRYEQTSNPGTIGATITTITHLTAIGASDPTSAPAGTVKIASVPSAQEGYLVWTVTYAKGAGTVLSEEGTRSGGKLKTYHLIALGSAPSAPSATIGGTVTLFESGYREAEGFKVYDYRWAEGTGQASIRTTGREDGSIVYNVTDLGAGAATPSYPGSGTAYLVALAQEAQDGYYLNSATYIKPQGLTYARTVSWTMPGLAVADNPPYFDPPVVRRLQATVTIAYSATPNASTAYTITTWARLEENFKRSSDGQEFSEIKSLDGYLGSSSDTGSNTTYRGIAVDSYAVTVSGSDPTTQPTGSITLEADAEPYLTSTAGTVIYRNTTVTISV